MLLTVNDAQIKSSRSKFFMLFFFFISKKEVIQSSHLLAGAEIMPFWGERNKVKISSEVILSPSFPTQMKRGFMCTLKQTAVITAIHALQQH